MSEIRQIEEAIQKLAGTYLRDLISIQACTVNDPVDKDNRTCDCTPIGGDADTIIPGVLLCAENNNGFLVFPEVGSTVIVALSTRNTAFVLMYSDVNSVQFMDGKFGGIPKIKDPDDATKGLLKKINNLENKMNDFFSKWNVFCTAYVPGSPTVTGSPPNLTTSNMVDLVVTIESEISNDLITHGK